MKNLLRSIIALTFGLTLFSCVDMSALRGDLKTQVDQTSSRTIELQKAVTDLNGQVKTLNEENNSVKALVAKVSDHVLAQQNKIEELEIQLKNMQSQPKSSSNPKPKRR